MRQGARIGSPDRIRPALRRQTERQLWNGVGEAWTALATLISGIVVWGGVGWGIDRLAGTRPIFFIIGALLGNFAGTYLIYVKNFRDVPTKPFARTPEVKRDET